MENKIRTYEKRLNCAETLSSIFTVLTFISLFFIIGTFGALELGSITFIQCIIREVIAIFVLYASGFSASFFNERAESISRYLHKLQNNNITRKVA